VRKFVRWIRGSVRDGISWFERSRRARLTRNLMREKGSDSARWSLDSSFESYWLDRNRALVTKIPPNSAVLEFGAGMRQLEKLLPAGCRYTPSDLINRSPGTLVCDLNKRPLPNFLPHDIIVLSGVLEYLHDPSDLLVQFHTVAPLILLSYAVWDGMPQSLPQRRKNGFVNDLSHAQFYDMLEKAGWRSKAFGEWQGQHLLRCERSVLAE
jgi:hypothetical protein